jgi:hypothetical protein
MWSRRQFIKTIGALGGALLMPFRKIKQVESLGLADEESSPEMELYEGFVILPENAPLPPVVLCAPAPILCNSDEKLDPSAEAFRGETSWFDSMDELASQVSFPVYIPGRLPADVRFLQGYVGRFAKSQKIYESRIDFGLTDGHQALISLSARPIFPRPYPVWRSSSHREEQLHLEQDSTATFPEKVDFTPAPGLMAPTEQGYVVYWMKQDVLYTLFLDYDSSREVAVDIVMSVIEK